MFHKILYRSASTVLALLLALTAVIPVFAAAPLNDNFADAEVISSLPFSATVDTTEATYEGNEPQICWFMTNTVWYSFTPSQDTPVTVDTFGSAVGANLNVFRATGSGINNLQFMGCVGGSQSFLFQANQTYYIQAGSTFGGTGNIQINLQEFTPPPVQPNFYYYPSDPSSFDIVQFCDNSYDPAGFGFSSYTWDFGDGATSTVNCAQHQYARDGDYTVQHSVTTLDGRTGSISQVVHVRTHDVAITKIAAPQSANSGQTRSITVSVNNKSYAETVVVELFKSVPGGFQSIGSYSQFVPARSSNRTITFTFNYTFSSADASIGKVTFKAVASIVNARDVFPADNEAISSPPTKVTR
jgi:hypothetical protein